MRVLLFAIVLAGLLAVNVAAQFSTEIAFNNYNTNMPVDIQYAPDGSDRIFIVEQDGIIYVMENDIDAQPQVFLDIDDRVDSGSYEEGLLGLCFHPNYANNGYFYVNYTANSPTRNQISRFSVSENDPDVADPNSELEIIDLDKPWANHNAGQVAFGPDGYLYISTGDGGSGGDPQNNGQQTTTLLGAMLRIDVDNTTDSTNYEIPMDNPFYNDTEGNQKEIYAWGLRNVWRFSFDQQRGWLWAADVGQNNWEYIHVIENGKNYGWKVLEGSHCYPPGSNCTDDTTAVEMELPVWEYSHGTGWSITGGYAYYGSALPLTGQYIYGDYGSGRIWALDYDGVNETVNTQLIDTNYDIATFGVDQRGEIYFAAANGNIYTITFTGSAIQLSDNELDFEFVPIGETDTLTLSIGSTGASTLTIDALTIEDEESEFYTIQSAPIVIEPGNIVDIGIVYDPENVGFADGTLVIESDAFGAETLEVSLLGESDLVNSTGERETTISDYRLVGNFPNPFNPTTTIMYQLPESKRINLSIFDTNGRLVRTAVDGRMTAGEHQFVWDGTDENDEVVATGVYFYRLKVGEFTDTKQMMFVQ